VVAMAGFAAQVATQERPLAGLPCTGLARVGVPGLRVYGFQILGLGFQGLGFRDSRIPALHAQHGKQWHRRLQAIYLGSGPVVGPHAPAVCLSVCLAARATSSVGQ
jgi:hypothetical protein